MTNRNKAVSLANLIFGDLFTARQSRKLRAFRFRIRCCDEKGEKSLFAKTKIEKFILFALLLSR